MKSSIWNVQTCLGFSEYRSGVLCWYSVMWVSVVAGVSASDWLHGSGSWYVIGQCENTNQCQVSAGLLARDEETSPSSECQ